MKTILRPLIVFVSASLVLASCTWFVEAEAENGQAALPVVQATQTLSDKVAVELTVQYDTAVAYSAVGQVIKFNYIVKVTKNDLTDNTPPNITFIGATPVCPAVNTVGNLNDRLDAGESVTCTFDYALAQADLDKGSVSNVVTAMVYTVPSNQAVTNVPTVPSKLLTLTKTANPTSYYNAGQTITYTYVIKNSGSSPLGPSQFTVADTGINNNAPFNCGNADATIAPTATLTCTATYTITSADLNVASIATNAVASGGGANPSQAATATITKTSAPALTTGSTAQHKVVEGEWLWQIARCYGADPTKTVAANPQLGNPAQIKEGMIVNVPNIGSNGTIHAPLPCVTKHTVQSGDTWTSIASKYGADPGLTQMVNGNTLTVGKEVKVPLYTQGLNIPLSSSSGTSGNIPLVLTVTASSNTYSQAGQIITFNYVIKNNGTASMGPAQFTVTDPLVGASAFNCGAANTTLAAGATVNCSANYAITTADMNLASISNGAVASASGVGSSSKVSITITKAGAGVLTLTISATPNTYSQQGQIITYKYVIKNSGAGNLGPSQFTVTDPLISASAFNCGGANTTLAANATVECNTNYTITQADMNLASISNNATATGGGMTSASASITITKSVVQLTLVVTANPTTYSQQGQTINFNYEIKNTGTSALGPTQFTVTDLLVSASAFNCGPENTTLSPGQSTTCSKPYTITQEDVGLSSITNEATASGGGAAPSQPVRITITKQ